MSEFKSFIQGHTAVKWWSQESTQVIDPKVIIYSFQFIVPCLKFEIKVNNNNNKKTKNTKNKQVFMILSMLKISDSSRHEFVGYYFFLLV